MLAVCVCCVVMVVWRKPAILHWVLITLVDVVIVVAVRGYDGVFVPPSPRFIQ